jgi:hypothetical protein
MAVSRSPVAILGIGHASLDILLWTPMRSLLTALLLAAASTALAQSVPTITLSKSDARFAEPFSSLAGMRELADGRLVVSDRLEQSVSVIDFRSGTVTPIGHQGQGPGEYTMPGPLFAFPGDSTMLLDLGNMRGIIVTADGRLGGTVDLQTPEGLPIIPRGVDGQGRLYAQPPLMLRGNATATASDSTPLLRLTPATKMIDTVAWLATTGIASGGAVGFRAAGSGGAPRALALRARPYAPEDGWAVAADGRIALARATGYHVEWLAPSGRRTAGPALPYEPVRIGKAEKEQWAEQRAKGSVMIMRTPQGSQTMRAPKPNVDEQDWPDTKPPFESQGVLATPEGDLWIRVSQPASARAAVFDVVDAAGRLVRRVKLPDGRRLVGFGKGTLYAVQTDADDLEWLERYRR